MSTITATIFAIITDNDQLHSELTRIMRKEYEPFLTRDRATSINTYKLEQYVHEELLKWYEWLPDTAISQIGGRTGNGSVQACGLEADSFPYSGRTANSRVESAIHDSAYDFPHVASSMNTLDAAGSGLDEDGKGGYRFPPHDVHSPL